MVQSAMLVALGFLLATFISLLLAPVVWKRAARLATERLKSSLPISLTDFHAEKDQLRAQHAIEMRGLELSLDQTKERTAEQMVDLGRQCAEILSLTGQVRELRSALSERKSLIAVMEQTLNVNVPRIKERLEKELNVTLQLNEQVKMLEGTVQKQATQLEESDRGIKLRDGEIQKLRQEVGASSAGSLFGFGKTRVNGLANGLPPGAEVDLGGLDLQEGGKGAAILKALQQENQQLHLVIETTKEQLLRAKAYEEKEVPLLRQEMRQLGTELLRGVDVPKAEPTARTSAPTKAEPQPVPKPMPSLAAAAPKAPAHEKKTKRSLADRLKSVANGGSVSEADA